MATSTIKKDIEWVKKTGDAMTGPLRLVSNSSNSFINLSNSDTTVTIQVGNANDGHGLYSNGYYNGSTYVSGGEWIIKRGTDGKVTVADHYNKDEVDAGFIPLGIDGINGNQTLTTIKNASKSGIYHVFFYDTINNLNAWGIVIVIVRGNVKTIQCITADGKIAILHTSDGTNWTQKIW